MSTPEGKVKKKVRDLIAEYDCIWSNWPVPGGYGTPMLDCVGCANAWAFSIETKAPGEDLTPRQRATAVEQYASNTAVFIISNDEGLRAFERWLQKRVPKARKYI